MPERSELIRFTEEHAAEVAAWADTPEAARYWAGPRTVWPFDPARFAAWHAEEGVAGFVLAEAEKAVAYGELWEDSEEQEVELARLLVKPSERGRGVGQELVHRLVARAEATGFPVAFLRLFPENAAARACYTRAGFAPVSDAEQEEYNAGQPTAYLWMRRALNPTS